ncbi:MAG: cytochrome c oxidase subunit 3 family protein [Planctomycetota bacterium]
MSRGAGAAAERFLAHHFEDGEHQLAAGKLGTWIFLVTEVLFFSGLFCAFAVFRSAHPEVFAWGAAQLDPALGAVNTGVLLVSSLTMAWAVRCAQLGQTRGLRICLAVTLLCAGAFLAIKSVEYAHKWHDGLLPGRYFAEADAPLDAHLFFGIYFGMTGLHGVHVLAGIAVIAWLLRRAIRGDFGPDYYGPVDFVALYWHLVDLVWIYLFPLLYLL